VADPVGDDGKAVLVAELRKLRPDKVTVVMTDGEKRPVAVPVNTRKRWDHVAGVLEGFAWARVECLNAKGELLGTIEAELDDKPGAAAAKALPQEYAIGDLIVKAQSEALRHFAPALKVLTDCLERITSIQDERNIRQERQIEELMRALEKLRVGAGMEASDDDAAKAIALISGGKLTADQVKALRGAMNGG